MFNYPAFEQSLLAINAKPAPTLFNQLDALYREQNRHYHNHTHVAECLTNLQPYRTLAQNPAEIEVAIWFHDAIYDTRSPDNEEQSAAMAERTLSAAKADSQSIARIASMIIATKTHQAGSTDEALMVDVDLGILGTPSHVFERYDDNIRREYCWVPEETYLAGRANVLSSFLDRERIYQTEQLMERFEAQARQNLANKIQQLNSKTL